MAEPAATKLVFAGHAPLLTSEIQHPLAALSGRKASGSKLGSTGGAGRSEPSSHSAGGTSASTATASSSSSTTASVTERPMAVSSVAGALVNCAEGRLLQGDIRGAYEDFREAVRLEPTNQEAWRRYEETYRAVERLMDEDHAKNPASSRCPSKGGGSDLGGGAPSRFSFVEHFPSDDSSRDSDGSGEDVALSWLQDGAGGGLGLGQWLGSGRFAGGGGQAALTTKASSSGVANRSARDVRSPVASESGRAMGSATNRFQQIELTIPNSRLSHLAMLAWLITTWLVVYYYTFAQRETFTTIGCVASVAVLCVFYGLYQCSRRKHFIICSLRITVKLICMLIVIGCMIYHYYRDVLGKTYQGSSPPTPSNQTGST